MKKLVFVLILGIALSGFSQKGKGPQTQKNDFTPEQRAVLKTKKMTLLLDLNQNQQDQLVSINKKWALERDQQKEMMQQLRQSDDGLSSDQRYDHMLKGLDNRMEYQKEVQKILSKEQYTVWKENQANSYQRGRENHQKGRRKQGGQKQGCRKT